MHDERVSLSLVIPCLDEAPSLPALLERCRAVFGSRGDVEVVLVDNGSTDGTPEVLERLLPDHPYARAVRLDANRGYGGGILAGLAAARGAILGWTHADLQTDPGDALAGLQLFAEAPAPERLFVKGRRRGRPAGDVAFTVGMALFESALLRRRLWDINAQPTLFHRRFYERFAAPASAPPAPTDFALDLYAYLLAAEAGLDIRRFAVCFGDRAHGRSHWNVDWRGKARFIRRTLVYSLRLRRDVRGSRDACTSSPTGSTRSPS